MSSNDIPKLRRCRKMRMIDTHMNIPLSECESGELSIYIGDGIFYSKEIEYLLKMKMINIAEYTHMYERYFIRISDVIHALILKRKRVIILQCCCSRKESCHGIILRKNILLVARMIRY